MKTTKKQIENVLSAFLPGIRKYDEESDIGEAKFQERLFKMQTACQEITKLVDSFAAETIRGNERDSGWELRQATSLYLPKEMSRIISELLSSTDK